MKKNNLEHSYLLNESIFDANKLFIMFTASMFCHILLFVLVIYAPKIFPSSNNNKFTPSAIDVNIVTMPTKKAAGKQGKPNIPQPVKAPVPEQKTVKTQEPVKEVPKIKEIVKEKPVEKKPVEKVVVNKQPEPVPTHTAKKESIEKVIEKPVIKPDAVSLNPKPKAPSKKENTSDSSQADASIKSALAQIKKKVEKSDGAKGVSDAINRLKNKYAANNSGGDDGDDSETVKGAGKGNGQVGSEKMNWYKMVIATEVQKNWVFPELAGGNKDLKTTIVIKILPDGTISEIWYDKQSGNSYLDDSAYKAIKKAHLPPLPEGYSNKNFTVGLNFTPTGVK